MKAREVKRLKLANRYAHKREEIAAKVKSGEMDHEEAWIALSKLPRNSNPIRQHNRCKITGRPKGYASGNFPICGTCRKLRHFPTNHGLSDDKSIAYRFVGGFVPNEGSCISIALV